ncbi:hypothetical protein [Vulgatibacter sp.]|uniref:hypothetical protein n=1 Tax=Vulgatibacter sp. TaxID=1971226 RepID=UPI0035672B52
MRRLAITLALLAAAGCGDISNEALEDLSFVQALPRAADLHLAAPDAGAQVQALEGEATGTVRSGLRICSRPAQQEPFCDGHRMARSINAFTALVLGTLDAVRSLEPTERADHRRVWGPFPEGPRTDRQRRETRVVVERGEGDEGYEYRWVVEIRPAARTAEQRWIPLLGGSFVPASGGSASRGAGYFTWDPTEARLASLETTDDTRRLEIRYDLRRGVRHVEADADFERDDLPATIRFVQEADRDGGAWRYEFPTDIDGQGEADLVEVRARWRADRAGRSDARITLRGSAFPGPFGNETCWDGRLERTYFSSDDVRQCEGGVCPEGDEASCVFPPLFE